MHAIEGVHALNVETPVSVPCQLSTLASHDEHRKDAVCSSHGLLAMENFSAHRGSLRGRPSSADAVVRRAISRHGLCAALLSRKPARHRSLPDRSGQQALPHGYQSAGRAFDARGCERATRLESLRFNREEVRQLWGQTATESQVRSVQQRSGGWPALLQLMLQHGWTPRFAASPTGES